MARVTERKVRKLIVQYLKGRGVLYPVREDDINVFMDDDGYAATANWSGCPWAHDFADWVADRDKYEALGDLVEIIDPLSDYEIGVKEYSLQRSR